MKTIVKLTTILVLFIATKTVAQNPPKTPKAPRTVSTTESTSSYSYSHSDDDAHESSSSSISVKKTNSLYKFRASFADEKTSKIKHFLQKEFSKMKNINPENPNRWSYHKNNEKVFECKLSEGHLRLFLDKEFSSEKMGTKIEALGEELKHLISDDFSAKTDLDNAKMNLEEAKKEYKRAQRNYKKAQQD